MTGTLWLLVDRLVRPRPQLALALLVGAVALWPLTEVPPAEAVDAAAADVALLEALAAGDPNALAAAGRRRLALAVVPPDVDRAFLIADALVRSGFTGEGIAVGEVALETARRFAGPDSSEVAVAANNLAWILASLASPVPEELDRAAALAAAAVAHDGENPFFLGTLGTVALARGDLAAAETHLRAAIVRHDPSALAATDRALLAIVLARRGDREGARAALDLARPDAPDPAWLRRAEEALAAP